MTNSTLHLLYPKVCWEVLTSHLSLTNSAQKSENKHLFRNINQTDHQKIPPKKTKEPPPENIKAWVFFTSSPFFGSQKVTPHPSFVDSLASGLATTFLAAFNSCAALDDGQLNQLNMVFGTVFFEKPMDFQIETCKENISSWWEIMYHPNFQTNKKMQRKHMKWNDLEMIRPVLGKLSY